MNRRRSTSNGSNGGRCADGRFAKNNPGGPGNPRARHSWALKRRMMDAISPQELVHVMRELYAAGCAGDTVAAALLLRYILGPPPRSIPLDANDSEPSADERFD